MAALYLDHAAASPPLPEALAAHAAALREAWANPSSLHGAGAAAALAFERARAELAETLGAPGWRAVACATGTEANALGAIGMARAARRRAERAAGGGPARALIGSAEHRCVREAGAVLAREGFAVEEVPVDAVGTVRPETLAALLRPDVALVAVQAANNEIGTLQPIATLAALTRARAPEAAFHCDAVQWAGKRAEAIAALDADAIAVAAHKLGGVRGSALLLLRPGARLPLPFWGGGQEGGLRAGTEDVAGLAAFAAAARARAALLRREPRALHARRAQLWEELKSVAPDLVRLGPPDESDCLGSILAVAVPGARARTLLTALDARGVQVGSGSACHGSATVVSPVLEAIGLAPALRGSVLRFSLRGDETPADLARAAAAFAEARAELAVTPARRG